jgi:hypothetical protein
MSGDRLRLVCTDRDTHPPHPLALIIWSPEKVDGFAVWDAKGDQMKHTPEPIAETVRATNAGPNKVTKRHAVETVRRADGGQTFHLPKCPTCGRRVRLRDDTLGKLLRGLADTPHGPTFDVSLRAMQ